MPTSALARPVFVALVALVAGCAAGAEDEVDGSGNAVIASQQAGAPTEFPEVVQVLVNNDAQDYCTGVLVSATRVLTAAHCMAVGRRFLVKAPHAPKPAEAIGRKGGAAVHSLDYVAEIEKEDAGLLELESPIVLNAYPEFRDVGELQARTLRAIAVGRNAEERNAPLTKTKELEVRSGTPEGYPTGLSSQFYSGGGDSGGPLFLIDDKTNKPMHVVIGIERQADPPSERFTRITENVIDLINR